MAVYIKPPKGNICLNKLCCYVKKRLLFLQFVRGKSFTEITNGIEQEKLVDGSECLIEGSVKDKISHFILRLLCSSDYEMRTFLIQTETEFFIYRLEFYNLSDVKRVMLDAAKQSKEILQYSSKIIKSYRNALSTFVGLCEVLEVALQRNYDYLKVPFIYALTSVRDRSYPVQSGFVHFPIKDLKNLLVSFFEEFLIQGMNQIKSSPCLHQLKDPQLSYMKKELWAWFKSNISLPSLIISNKKIITENNLNLESLKFPLCMKNMHFVLRKFHRLQHHARIQYTLFLKEIGVPYQEVIELFMKEYSMPSEKINNCTHSWDDSKNRYIYSIEHLFGKRGSGKNYRAHSCHSLQSGCSNSIYDGGCPFSFFDDDNMGRLLTSENMKVKDIEDLQILTNDKNYTESCCTYLSKKLQSIKQCPTSSSSQSFDSKPVSEDGGIDGKNTNHKINSKHRTVNNANHLNYSTTSLSLVLSKPSDFYFIISDFTKHS